MAPTLRTERLAIRRLRPSDADAIFAIFRDPDVCRYWSSPPMVDRSEAVDLIKSARRGYRTGSHYAFGIERVEDRRVIGTCTLWNIVASSRRCELGYALGREHWGFGYMSEALPRLLAFAFDELDLNRIEADIDPRNEASERSLLRLGFAKEGFMPQRWIVAGEVGETAFYGLLRDQWRASCGRDARVAD